jgi:hypothetical protein
MAELINLRTARKQADRKHAAKCAAENRLAHGRPKSESKLEATRNAKASRDLDQHRIERGEADEIARR